MSAERQSLLLLSPDSHGLPELQQALAVVGCPLEVPLLLGHLKFLQLLCRDCRGEERACGSMVSTQTRVCPPGDTSKETKVAAAVKLLET